MKRFAYLALLGTVLFALPSFADWRGGPRHHHGHSRAGAWRDTRSSYVQQQNGQYVLQSVQRWVPGSYVSVWVRGRQVSRWQPGQYVTSQEWVWVPTASGSCNTGW